ncbi:DMT family transporter [Mesorhizobium sp. CGMCC 1.15528]|uniref:DMT family transporter n=1 Tax=Mesorhizobium zhangyense TaxID=1776730 RepID=A0A7C9R609_9HYPH|nr:DMT family transporter [Mesorhizobium zhangyense]NGN40759.1 DMT family transporter [Mesorhizobium zhangyense]
MTPPRANPLHLLAAFGSGGLLTLMIHFNGELARYGNALFASWTAHGTGTIAALIFLAVLWRRAPAGNAPKIRTPLWAYLGGVSGAATVMFSSIAVNSPLALSGTLALGLVGQMIFSLAADRWGLFGLPMRRPGARDFAALGLVLAGSAIIILFGKGAA